MPPREPILCQPQHSVHRTSSAFDACYSHKTKNFIQLHEQKHCVKAACEMVIKWTYYKWNKWCVEFKVEKEKYVTTVEL